MQARDELGHASGVLRATSPAKPAERDVGAPCGLQLSKFPVPAQSIGNPTRDPGNPGPSAFDAGKHKPGFAPRSQHFRSPQPEGHGGERCHEVLEVANNRSQQALVHVAKEEMCDMRRS
jgi:hypothetical protein